MTQDSRLLLWVSEHGKIMRLNKKPRLLTGALLMIVIIGSKPFFVPVGLKKRTIAATAM
jgi:hypothetical protein